jgi:hypothetical protein
MLVIHRPTALLAFGAPFLLLTLRSVCVGTSPRPAAAATRAPVDNASPRSRISQPSERLAASPTRPPQPGMIRIASAPSTSSWILPLTPEPPARHPRSPSPGNIEVVRRWRPGLFTVDRVGHRLLYRKGYLGDVPVHLVVANMDDPEIKIGVMVAQGGIGSAESLEHMVQRARPTAAITGTFFGLSNRLPTGDLVVNGHAVYQGFVGTAVAFTEGNLVSFIPTGYKEKPTWRFFDGVMRAGPLLMQAGRIAVGPREEGFVSLSPAARRPRTAVGITRGRKLLLLAVKEPISLWRLAKLMNELGAYHAVALDGGTSTGMYFRGRLVARPGRALTNALVVYADKQQYQQAKSSFLGGKEPLLSARDARGHGPMVPASPPILLELQPAPDGLPALSNPMDSPPAEGTDEPLAAVDPAVPLPPLPAPAPTVPSHGHSTPGTITGPWTGEPGAPTNKESPVPATG